MIKYVNSDILVNTQADLFYSLNIKKMSFHYLFKFIVIGDTGNKIITKALENHV